MPLSRRRFSGLLALIPAVMLPLPALAQMQQLDGHVTYRERMALPADTVTEIRLEDVSLADAPAQVIARQVIRDAVASPIPFRLTFDSTAIQPGHDYALRAQIRDGDDLLFTTTTHHPAFGPSQDITVQRVAQSPALPLGGDWLAEDIQGGGVIDRAARGSSATISAASGNGRSAASAARPSPASGWCCPFWARGC